MRFVYENREELDKEYLHDGVFEGYQYHYEKRQIEMSCIDGFFTKRIHLVFNNVIFSEMQSCEFWGSCARIYEIWHEDESFQMKYLQDILKSDKNKYDINQLTEGIDFIQVKIQIISGDTLFIICESLDWTEEELKDEDII